MRTKRSVGEGVGARDREKAGGKSRDEKGRKKSGEAKSECCSSSSSQRLLATN